MTKLASFLLTAGLLVLSGCGDSELDIANEALIKASAAIKTPLQLDQYTTLVKVWVPQRLAQEFVYDVTAAGLPVFGRNFPELQDKIIRQACSSTSHVVKYGGSERYVWMHGGQSVRLVYVSRAECNR